MSDLERDPLTREALTAAEAQNIARSLRTHAEDLQRTANALRDEQNLTRVLREETAQLRAMLGLTEPGNYTAAIRALETVTRGAADAIAALRLLQAVLPEQEPPDPDDIAFT